MSEVSASPTPTRMSDRSVSALLRRADFPMLMPYLYVLVLGIAIFLLEPNLIRGPGAVDIRFGLVLPLALVAFGQSLVIFTRGIDLSIGG